jgi:Ca-activated chloride channel family protein
LSYANLALVHEAKALSQSLRRHIPPLLFIAALVLMVTSVARPTAVITLPSEHRTIILAIDVSYSMAATDAVPTRLAAAKAAAKTFVSAQPEDVRIGVLAFAGEADLVQPPTTDRGPVLQAIDRLDLQSGTAIGTAIIAALRTIFPASEIGGQYEIFGMGHTPVVPRALIPGIPHHRTDDRQPVPAGSDRSTAVVLLTDGHSTLGLDPLKAAQFAADRGIRIYTVGFGAPGGTRIEIGDRMVEAELDEAVLENIAKQTGAEYFRADTAQGLKDVYRALSTHVVLETRIREITALLTAAAALLLLASMGLSLAWSSRLA